MFGLNFELFFKNLSISQYRKILLLQMSGVSWWLLCSGWASDCFWGRLSWPEICRWLCLVVLCPADYQAFFFICLAASRKRQWLEAFNLGRFRETVYQVYFEQWIQIEKLKLGYNTIVRPLKFHAQRSFSVFTSQIFRKI